MSYTEVRKGKTLWAKKQYVVLEFLLRQYLFGLVSDMSETSTRTANAETLVGPPTGIYINGKSPRMRVLTYPGESVIYTWR